MRNIILKCLMILLLSSSYLHAYQDNNKSKTIHKFDIKLLNKMCKQIIKDSKAIHKKSKTNE